MFQGQGGEMMTNIPSTHCAASCSPSTWHGLTFFSFLKCVPQLFSFPNYFLNVPIYVPRYICMYACKRQTVFYSVWYYIVFGIICIVFHV
jgi:hypothetical protein